MDTPYVYYIPIYPDDDCCETLLHLFIGAPGLDDRILTALEELDDRERRGEGVDYVRELEMQLGLKRVEVRQLVRDRRKTAATTH